MVYHRSEDGEKVPLCAPCHQLFRDCSGEDKALMLTIQGASFRT